MKSPTTPSMLRRLDEHDRALFLRWSHGPASSARWTRHGWAMLTHAGGATATVLASVIPMLLPGSVHDAARLALVTLVASHVIVQLIKRGVGRPRPSSVVAPTAFITAPDRFSFPSGHAAAAMSVAFGYAAVFPTTALPLVVFAGLVGVSRVRLGVHYLGDVLAGQVIAVATGAFIIFASGVPLINPR